MKSRITIDLNESNQPVIKVEYLESPDVRDSLVKRFLESVLYTSNKIKINKINESSEIDVKKTYFLELEKKE